MKIPSNRMPKYEMDEGEPKWYVSAFLWMLIILFSLAVLYLIFSLLYTYENFKYIFLLFVAAVVVQNIIYRRKNKKILSSRKNWGIGCFAKEFDLKVTDTWVVRAVYEAIYDLVELPIKADDDIDKDLGISIRELEFEEILIYVSYRTSRVLPNESILYDNIINIKTVRDLVEFFNALPQHDKIKF